MENIKYAFIILLIVTLALCSTQRSVAQRTQIKGFADASAYYQKGKASFALGEQDLFITSEITERLSFLGETVFKYSLDSPTDFDISIERIILKYNYAGNHSILIGKHHTPVNYWNDTYHHGRVFFPTVDRPLIFSEGIIPLHTTGVSLQGQNLGRIRFGYDLMVGNGLGSGDVQDNNIFKSLTAAIHIKPKDGMRIGASLYHDVISKGSTIHNHYSGVSTLIPTKVNQNIMTASISYNDSIFSKKYELLAESSMVMNKSDSLGMQDALASYVYAGLRVTDKIIPYIRFDDIRYKNKEVYFLNNNVQSFVGGLRYELSYLAVLKLEYQHVKNRQASTTDRLVFQVAVGF
ncbi:hypothetical protein [Hymenobacter sp. GOD-10R]|uniref:hypothetical protein n=1 Tax=Hymenobacter sp. GOD-10R TaxID=3093922 RepID=UPI002D781113|nr:hypothetical protein [Hymenobacter sp. GOD-10R]WRQ28370.1 hypothetical protein SD425_25195 [Hymenobacter sp. GOD-10R]